MYIAGASNVVTVVAVVAHISHPLPALQQQYAL